MSTREPTREDFLDAATQSIKDAGRFIDTLFHNGGLDRNSAASLLDLDQTLSDALGCIVDVRRKLGLEQPDPAKTSLPLPNRPKP